MPRVSTVAIIDRKMVEVSCVARQIDRASHFGRIFLAGEDGAELEVFDLKSPATSPFCRRATV
jgi:hypothetical protein